MKKTITILLSIFVISQIAHADNRMVISANDGTSTVWLNDKFARAKITKAAHQEDDPIAADGMLIDFSSGKTYAIIKKEKILLDTSSPPMIFAGIVPKTSPAKKIKITYQNKGKGEKIAGLSTTKYEIIAEGEKCFDMLITKNEAYGAVMKKFKSLPDNHENARSLCERVDNQINSDTVAKYGHAVKSTSSNGQLDMLLLEFETGLKAPKKYLSFPAGYKIKTLTEMMQEMMAGNDGRKN